MGQGDIPTAIEVFSKVVMAAPHAHSAFANLGVCYHILGQNEVAIDWFKVRRLRVLTQRVSTSLRPLVVGGSGGVCVGWNGDRSL
jgi:hypothetical protein